MVSIAYTNFTLSNAVLLLAKLLLESKSLDHVQIFPTVQKSPPLPYASGQLYQIKVCVLHWTW